MAELLNSTTGTGILIGAIAGLIIAITNLLKQVGPEIVKTWYSEKIKAEEFKRTREEAARIAQAAAYGELIGFIRDDQTAERNQRIAELEEAKAQRGQFERLIKSISELVSSIDRTSDRVTILNQNTAQIIDSQRRMEWQMKTIQYYIEQGGKNTKPAKEEDGS